VSYNSGNTEWYTPPEIIEAARRVLGEIDLDPASSEAANVVVKAKRIYTQEDSGLLHPWTGRVWLNPPYSAGLVREFVGKLGREYDSGNVRAAIVLVNNATETQWFRMLVEIASAICFPTGRIKYWRMEGSMLTPLQGQALLYIGDDVEKFRKVFGGFGWVTKIDGR